MTGAEALNRLNRAARSRALGVTLILAALATVFLSATTAMHQRRNAACQARYNAAFAEALTERTRATDRDRAALDRMVIAVATAKERGTVRAALDNYVTDRAAADAERRRHPLPEPPRGRCG